MSSAIAKGAKAFSLLKGQKLWLLRYHPIWRVTRPLCTHQHGRPNGNGWGIPPAPTPGYLRFGRRPLRQLKAKRGLRITFSGFFLIPPDGGKNRKMRTISSAVISMNCFMLVGRNDLSYAKSMRVSAFAIHALTRIHKRLTVPLPVAFGSVKVKRDGRSIRRCFFRCFSPTSSSLGNRRSLTYFCLEVSL